ncbi:MAG: type II secretion system protein [Planctomycetes bacterium]|nr:type II secretion system protein [Planctomycetota bacterium]
MIDRSAHRRGFSGIEILVVLSVMATLASMSMPMLLTAMRRARIHDASNAIVEVSSQARRLAKRSAYGSDWYGVVISNQTTPRYVALTRNGSVMMEGATPVSKLTISPNVIVYDGAAPLVDGSARSSWMYQQRSALPILVASPTAPNVSILGLVLQTMDGRMRSAIDVYSVGLVNVQDL